MGGWEGQTGLARWRLVLSPYSMYCASKVNKEHSPGRAVDGTERSEPEDKWAGKNPESESNEKKKRAD